MDPILPPISLVTMTFLSVITSKASKAQSAINIKKQRTKWAKDKGCPPQMAQLQMQFHSSAFHNQQKHLHTTVFKLTGNLEHTTERMQNNSYFVGASLQ